MPKHTFEEILEIKKYKEEKLNIRFESYEDFLKRNKVLKYIGNKCFVLGCDKQAEYEGGDSRYYCGMCEKHANMKERYIEELENILGIN